MFRWSSGIAIRMLKKPCKSLGVLKLGCWNASKYHSFLNIYQIRLPENQSADVVYTTVVTHRLQRGLDYNAKRMLARDPHTTPPSL